MTVSMDLIKASDIARQAPTDIKMCIRDSYKLTDYKQKAFFKRSFNGRKDKTVFYILKMFNKNILENPSYISLIYSNSVY